MRRDRLIYVLTFLLAIWCLFLASSLSDLKKSVDKDAISVNEYNVTGFSTDLTRAIELAKASIVHVSGPAGSTVGYICSVDEDYVFVACDYPEFMSGVRVYYDSGIYEEAEVFGRDASSGITILRVKSAYEVPVLSTSDSFNLKTGEFVLAVRDDGSICQYTLSSVSHDEVLTYDGFSVRLSGDQSVGSIILNMNGDMVGIVKSDGQMMDVNEIRMITSALIKDDMISRIDLGVRGTFVSRMENYLKSGLGLDLDLFAGLYVDGVKASSFAQYCGIEAGDVIVSINNEIVDSSSDLVSVIYSGMSDFEIVVMRGGNDLTLRGSVE